MKKSNFKIVIVGAGASGKDYMRKKFQNKGAICAVPTTTRPIREGEIDGKEYKFVTVKEYRKLQYKKNFVWNYEADVGFDIWHYGLDQKEWERCDVAVVNPISAIQMHQDGFFDNCLVILLKPPKEVLWERLRKRDDTDDAKRRFTSDIKDLRAFNKLNIADVVIKNYDW